MSQAQSQSSAAKFNARVADNNAELARQQAGENARRQQIKARRSIAQARANVGASGISVEGSALDVLEESARNSELDRLTILHGGEIGASGFGNDAILARARARNAQTAGNFGAARSVFGGAADILLRGNFSGPPPKNTG